MPLSQRITGFRFKSIRKKINIIFDTNPNTFLRLTFDHYQYYICLPVRNSLIKRGNKSMLNKFCNYSKQVA